MNTHKLILLISCTLTLLHGCSVYQAAHAPDPVEYKAVKLGSTRTETIATLGYPKMTDQKNNQKIDTFEFQDGYHAASKARIVLYLAGDVFTAGLAEFIFWPLEENVFDGQQCKGTVTYDVNNSVIGYDLKDNDGEELMSSPVATVKD
ncbi:MAG: hypothetical protein HOP02_15905 [Methylococcaceae bacterium]|nr:hypothetical protein [Methylococcaceae bacterium]